MLDRHLRIAFDEPHGHLSHLFKGRLFRVSVGHWIEECVVTDVSTHPVEQELNFVRFDRHVPGKMRLNSFHERSIDDAAKPSTTHTSDIVT